MKIGEAVLRAFSRKPKMGDYNQGGEQEPLGEELTLLRREFPHFSTLVKGKRVVDFGCGAGRLSVALVKEEGCYVCGIDTNTSTLSKAKKLASERGLTESNIVFLERPACAMLQTFDIVISQNAMEHFRDPIGILNTMKGLIHEDGKILITFGPPWFSPYGPHMYFFCKVPWLNLLFSERTVMNVRALYRNDGAKRYEEVESGLNKMTIKKFESIISHSGLSVRYKKYSCIKRQNWMAKLPVLRELAVNVISCILVFERTPTQSCRGGRV